MFLIPLQEKLYLIPLWDQDIIPPCTSYPAKSSENSGTNIQTHGNRYRRGMTTLSTPNGILRQTSRVFTAMPAFWPTTGSCSTSRGTVTDLSWQSSTLTA